MKPSQQDFSTIEALTDWVGSLPPNTIINITPVPASYFESGAVAQATINGKWWVKNQPQSIYGVRVIESDAECIKEMVKGRTHELAS